MVQASVILVVKNRADPLFPKCIESLKKSRTSEFEYIVVDNGSNEKSIELVLRELKPNKMIVNKRNVGVAEAFNIGAAQATSPALLFVTHDVVPDSMCLDTLTETIISNDTIGPVGCKLLYPNRKYIQHAGAYLEFPRCMGFHIGRQERDKGQFDQQGYVDYVTGAIFGISRHLWKYIGGFDGRFHPAYYEDSDFCIRLSKKGHQSWYQPKAVATHGENSTTKNRPRVRAWLLHLNRFRFVFKHLSTDELIDRFVSAELEAFYETSDEIERAALRRAYNWNYFLELPIGHESVEGINEAMRRIRLNIFGRKSSVNLCSRDVNIFKKKLV